MNVLHKYTLLTLTSTSAGFSSRLFLGTAFLVLLDLTTSRRFTLPTSSHEYVFPAEASKHSFSDHVACWDSSEAIVLMRAVAHSPQGKKFSVAPAKSHDNLNMSPML